MGILNQSIPYERLTCQQIIDIVNPIEGMIKYNTDHDKLAIYINSKWVLSTIEDMPFILAEEDFETGNIFTLVNDSENVWIRGTDNPAEGTYALYISDDGAGQGYNESNSEVSHAYIDLSIPAGITSLKLRFKWICEGEVNFDYGNIYKTPTSITPSAGTEVSSSYKIGKDEYNDNGVWEDELINLGTADAGTDIRLIFSWKNDGSVGTSPGFGIDSFKVCYTL